MMKKLFLNFILLTSLAFPAVVHASAPEVYPLYGYNVEENLCQIKQASAEALVQENLTGEYWNLRECRRENLQVFLNTGFGIVIWFFIFSLVFVSNFLIFPRLHKKSHSEKMVGTIFDLAIIGLILFFALLLQHYFLIPQAYYDYGSDFDQLVYANFIHPRGALIYSFSYLFLLIARTGFLFLVRSSRR